MGTVNAESVEIAVVIPCYNEAAAIGSVVRDARAALPHATVYVYDNNSTDDTIAAARAAGAVVRCEGRQGKGNVVRRMFADIEAEVFVLADGDGTYDLSAAPKLVERLIQDHLDMVNGRRVDRAGEDDGTYRVGHRFGNRVLTRLVSTIFGGGFDDMLSGYKVFSRRFVKSFPSLSSGFEIETELTVHALELRMPVSEIDTDYGVRVAGSESKLSTFGDGLRILRTIARLVKDERPLQFFSALFAILFGSAVVLSIPLILTYVETGLVPRLPTAVLVTGMTLLGFICLACGLILETVTRGRKELKRLHYLSVGETSNTS